MPGRRLVASPCQPVPAPGTRHSAAGRPRGGGKRPRPATRTRASKASKTRGSAPLPTTSIALVLIEDNRLLREGITAMIHSQPGFKVLAASADVDEAMRRVREAKPDVVLLDFGLETHDSLGLTKTVHEDVPRAKVIVMGLLPGAEDVAEYVHAGASGFIMKNASFEEFFSTIRAVANGVQILPRALTHSLLDQIAKNALRGSRTRRLEAVRLTNREQQVIDLLGEGLSNKEIATRLHIAVHTVKSHVHNVLEKLALHSRLEVAAFTHRGGPPKAPQG